MHGDKISEKANSLGYAKYSMFDMCWEKHTIQKLNSPNLKKKLFYFKCHYSSVKNESNFSIIRVKRDN